MYTDLKIQESIRKVEAARAENVKLSPARMSAEEKENLLKTFHPDYRENQFTTLRIGPNKGGKVPLELAALLEGKPRVELSHPHLDVPDYDADVLIIGGGGAGCAAAIEANNTGAKVLLALPLLFLIDLFLFCKVLFFFSFIFRNYSPFSSPPPFSSSLPFWIPDSSCAFRAINSSIIF